MTQACIGSADRHEVYRGDARNDSAYSQLLEDGLAAMVFTDPPYNDPIDPFLGSGTTVIAAERAGRLCYDIELEPRYGNTVERPWQKSTGLEAVHKGAGQTFAQREKETAYARQG